MLYDEIQDLLSDRDRLHRMGHDATKLAAHDASEKIYQEIPLGNPKPWQK